MLSRHGRHATIRGVMLAQQGPFHGLFQCHVGADGLPHLSPVTPSPGVVPCPVSGNSLRVSTVDAEARAICPSCARHGHGAFVSFEGDLRMAYACPACRQLVWLPGA